MLIYKQISPQSVNPPIRQSANSNNGTEYALS
jgi:hypothetical protein